ncbi:MAG: HD domain-containing protein, partial [Planctomycetota bacterium]|nr:HD domain-containing protein [Planctomycetota bacterium]
LIQDIIETIDKYSVDRSLSNICENIITFMQADVSVIYLQDKAENEVYVAASFPRDSGYKLPVKMKLGKGIAGQVAQSHEPILAGNGSFGAQLEEEYGQTGNMPVSMLAMPLVAFEMFLGVIELANFQERRFAPIDMTRLQPLVNIAALAIPRDTDEGFTKLAEICVRFLEEKDRYTHGHSLRVMKYSLVIAEECGMTRSQRDELRLCALLHDIGKVVLKDSLLNKTGALTKNELQTIRMHPTIGCNIVDKISRSLSRKILSHHEKFDGTGYPEGLKGDQIPVIARIIAIGDTLDAVTTDRPYRSAADLEYAVQEIAAHGGTQFDPTLVDALVQAFKKGRLALVKV